MHSDRRKRQPTSQISPVPLLILGTYMLAVELTDLVSDIPSYRLAGFVENQDPERCQLKIEGLPVHWIDSIGDLARDHYAVCGISTTHRVGFIQQAASHGMRFATLIHPTARVSSRTPVGEGSVIGAGVQVGARSQIGKHVFVNRGALIGHHTRISDYVTIQPGANVAGACEIGEGTYIAIGALVLERKKIGAHSFVGAGAMVTKDLPDHVQAVGSPARIVKRNIAGR
jgi:sugar O-acyltransferase (sialic acid O-acetyltransferase NeuD family)